MNSARFILCADDFALSASSSQGIFALLAKARLSAVSCVVNTELWPQHGPMLLPFLGNTVAAQKPKGIDVGLHFNLTEGVWISDSSIRDIGLTQLILKAYTHRLSTAMIMQELLAQIDAFTQIMGKTPDFIDGHQHIQQFPVIRQAILAWLTTQTSTHKPYLRCSYLQHLSGNDRIKRWVINRLGAKKLKNQLAKTNIPHNKTFSGVYDFSPHANYRHLFQQFLREVNHQGMIMCHPAQGFDPNDPHTLARQQEWAYFMSDDFLEDCTTAGMSLSRGDFLSASL